MSQSSQSGHLSNHFVVFQYKIDIPINNPANFFEFQKGFDEFATSSEVEACYIYEPRYASPSKRFKTVYVTFLMFYPTDKLYMNDKLEHIFFTPKGDYNFPTVPFLSFMSTDPDSIYSANDGFVFVDSAVRNKSITKSASKTM